jgi:N-methylhydantoinase A
VLVPPHAGVLSALGLVAAPVTVDVVATRMVDAGAATAAELDAAWRDLENRAQRQMAEQGAEVATARRAADLRYRGQAFELEVVAESADPADLVATFHRSHRERYGYDQPEADVEVVNLRVRLESAIPDLPIARIGASDGVDAAVLASRRLRISGEDHDVPVATREGLGVGDHLRGPAVIVGVESTCWVAPWQHLEVDEFGSLVITEAGP